MSIDKGPEPVKGRKVRVPAGQFLFNIGVYAVWVTPLVALPIILWAIELGVIIRVLKEAFSWGYDLLGF